jgi:hypothetical protein
MASATNSQRSNVKLRFRPYLQDQKWPKPADFVSKLEDLDNMLINMLIKTPIFLHPQFLRGKSSSGPKKIPKRAAALFGV